MSTAVEQSLQIVLQEPAAAIAVAVLLGGGLVGMSIRNIVESVVVDENSRPDDGESVGDPDGGRTESDSETPTGTTVESTDAPEESDGTADPEELEHRLDELETEVGSLSSTVDTVRNENEQISNSVEEVEQSTSRLVSLFKRAIGGGTTAPAPAGDTESTQSQSPVNTETDDGTEIEETEIIETGGAGTEFQEKANASSDSSETASKSDGTAMGVREKHCVDSDEEIIDAPQQDAFQANAGSSAEENTDTTEEVEEIGTGTFEGTRFQSPDTKSESFGIEETIETPAVASDGGTAVANETNEPGSDSGPAEPESPSIPEPAVESSDESAESERSEPDVQAEAAQLVAEADPAKSSADQPAAEASSGTVSTPEPASEAEPDLAASTETESPAALEKEQAPEIEPETTAPESTTASDPVATLEEITPTDGQQSTGKPYLETLPEGFGAELLTVEWLEYLVTEVGIRETSRALEYYETIGWLTDETAAELDNYLDGLEAGDRGSLSVEHHLRTLEYVDELTMGNAEDIR